LTPGAARPFWIVAAFVLLVVGATFFEGLVGLAGIDAAARLPFEDGIYARPATAATPMPFIDPSGENLHQPADRLSMAELRAGRLPLWNPHGGLGTPHLAAGEAAPFNPLKWLFLLPARPVGVPQAWFLVSRLAVCALGLVLLARRLGLGPWGAALAALAGTLNAFNAYHLHFTELHTFPLFPYLLWAADRFAERPSVRRTAAFGLLIGLTGLLGHPEAALLAAGAAWVVAAFAPGAPRVGRVPGLVGASLLGGAFACVMVVPFLAHVRGAVGYLLDRPQATEYLFHDVVWMLARHFLFVEPDVNAYNYNAWIGTPALLLAPLGLASPAVRRVALPVLGAFAVGFAILPPSNLVDILKISANAFYLMPLLTVPLALLAGAGLDAVLARPDGRRVLAAAGAAVALAAYVGLLYHHNPAFYARLPRVWTAVAFGLPFAVALVAARKLPGGATGGLIVGLAALELANGARIAVPRLPLFTFEPPPVVRRLLAEPPPFRVTGMGYLLVPNTATYYGIDLLDLQQVFFPKRYVAFMEALNGRPRTWPSQEHVRAGCSLPLLDLANVRFLLLAAGDKAMTAMVAAHPDRFRQVMASGGLAVYENLQALPRTWIAAGADFTVSADAPRMLMDAPERWRTRALIETPDGRPPAGWQPGPPGRGSARVAARGAGDLTIEANLEAPGWLVVAEQYDPGWAATVDGRPAQVYAADVALRALPLPPGRHQVAMRYAPPVVEGSLAVSLAGLAIGLGLLAWRGQSSRVATAT
jgi:hypothetical protein